MRTATVVFVACLSTNVIQKAKWKETRTLWSCCTLTNWLFETITGTETFIQNMQQKRMKMHTYIEKMKSVWPHSIDVLAAVNFEMIESQFVALKDVRKGMRERERRVRWNAIQMKVAWECVSLRRIDCAALRTEKVLSCEFAIERCVYVLEWKTN